DKPADYYGLSLILGGAESSLWDITKAYAGMASTLNFFNNSSSEYRKNEFVEPVYMKDYEEISFGEIQQKPSVWNAGEIYEAFEAMEKVNRPSGEENREYFTSSQQLAWKTGTSYGFKDAWAVGVTPKYANGVGVVTSDGYDRPGVAGIQADVTVLLDVLNFVPQSGLYKSPYNELVEGEICTKSCHLA